MQCVQWRLECEPQPSRGCRSQGKTSEGRKRPESTRSQGRHGQGFGYRSGYKARKEAQEGKRKKEINVLKVFITFQI